VFARRSFFVLITEFAWVPLQDPGAISPPFLAISVLSSNNVLGDIPCVLSLRVVPSVGPIRQLARGQEPDGHMLDTSLKHLYVS
jgi:hypothetical protein